MPVRPYIDKYYGKELNISTEFFECNVCGHQDIETTNNPEYLVDETKPKYKKRCKFCRNIWYVNSKMNRNQYMRKDFMTPEEIEEVLQNPKPPKKRGTKIDRRKKKK